MQLNVDKSYFATIQFDYLCYIISRREIAPQRSKVQLIVDIPRLKSTTQVKRLSGIINFYRDLWKKRAHLLTPVMELTRKTVLLCGQTNKMRLLEYEMLHYQDLTRNLRYVSTVEITELGRSLVKGEDQLHIGPTNCPKFNKSILTLTKN